MKQAVTFSEHEIINIVAQYAMEHCLCDAKTVNVSMSVRFGELECIVREIK